MYVNERCSTRTSYSLTVFAVRYYKNNEMLRVQNANCVDSSYHLDVQSGFMWVRNFQQICQIYSILTSVPKHIIAHYIIGPKSSIKCFSLKTKGITSQYHQGQLIALLASQTFSPNRNPNTKRHPTTVCYKNLHSVLPSKKKHKKSSVNVSSFQPPATQPLKLFGQVFV